MKTISASLLVFLAISAGCFAQQIRIAPVLGPNASTTLKSSYVKDEMKETGDDFEAVNPGLDWVGRYVPSLGFLVGGLADYSLNETLSFQSGVLLHLRQENYTIKIKGTDMYGDRVNAKGGFNYRISYLEIPLWIRYAIGNNGLKLIGGPSFGFALGGKVTAKLQGYGQDVKESTKLAVGKDAFGSSVKPFDFGLNLGVGKEFQIGNNPLELTVFVQPSFSKWNPSSAISPDYWQRHFSTGIRAAYYFTIR